MMTSMRFKLQITLFATLGLACMVFGDTRNWNPTGEGCVDSEGFLSCYQKQSDIAATCASECNMTVPTNVPAIQMMPNTADQTCLQGCDGGWLAGNLGCWIQSCWNEVYSCEYQLTAISYFNDLGLAQNENIPFYPPPDSASAGACSCNLGYVYGNQTFVNMNNVCLNVIGMTAEEENDCSCCEFSFPVSNILNVCPNSNLSILDFAEKLASAQQLLQSSTTDNCAVLDSNSGICVSEFNFPFDGPKVYNPLNLPPGIPGNDPVSNLPGNALTEFGESVYTFQLFPAFTSIITPIPFNNKAGAPTETIDASLGLVTGTGGIITGSGGNPTVTGGGTGPGAVATGKATETGIGASATKTKTSDGARAHGSSTYALWVLVLVTTRVMGC